MRQQSLQAVESSAPYRFGQAASRIVYVGDGSQDWFPIRQFLRERTDFVLTETDTLRVLERLLSWPGHLRAILADARSTQCDVAQVLELVANCGTNVPVVVLTDHASEKAAAQFVEQGAAGYVVGGQGVELRLPIALHQAIRATDRDRDLAHARAELTEFFGLCREMLCVLNLDGRILQSNAALRELMGFDPAAAINPNLFRFVHAEHVLMLQEQVRRAAAQAEPVHFSLQCRTRTGDDVWTDWSLVRSPDRSRLLATAHSRPERAASAMEARANAQSKLNTLSQREHEILQLVVEGMPNKVIARRLSLSEKTVEKHRSHGMKKLHVHSVPDLVRLVLLGGS